MRLSHATLRILRALLAVSDAVSGADLTRATGVPSGTMYPTLERLERAGWLAGRWESGDPRVLGRPLRRLYRLTAIGERRAREVLEGLR